MEKRLLTNVAHSIKSMDEMGLEKYNMSHENQDRLSIARTHLINVIFSEGYELDRSYRVIKSKHPRTLIKLIGE